MESKNLRNTFLPSLVKYVSIKERKFIKFFLDYALNRIKEMHIIPCSAKKEKKKQIKFIENE